MEFETVTRAPQSARHRRHQEPEAPIFGDATLALIGDFLRIVPAIARPALLRDWKNPKQSAARTSGLTMHTRIDGKSTDRYAYLT